MGIGSRSAQNVVTGEGGNGMGRTGVVASVAMVLALATAACSGGGGQQANRRTKPRRSTTTTSAPTTTTSGTTPTSPSTSTTTTRRTPATTRVSARCGGAALIEAPAGTLVQVRRCSTDSADYTFGFRVGVFTQVEACAKGVAAVRSAGFRITRDRCAEDTATFAADGISGTIDTTIPNGTIRVGWIRRG